MAVKVGSLLGELGIDTARWSSGLKSAGTSMQKFQRQAQKDFRKIRRSVNRLVSPINTLTASLLALAGPAAIGVLTKESFQLIDAQAKLADTFDMSVSALAGFELAGERTGATATQVKKSFEKMAVNVSDAAQGIGTAKDAFKALNLDAKELIELPMEEQFKLVADRMKLVENATERVGLAYDIFGRQGTNMVKMLGLSREEFEAFEERAIRLGVAVSRVDSAKVEEANDMWLEVTKAIRGVGNTIAVELAPLVSGFARQFVDSAVAADGWKKQVRGAIEAVLKGAGFIADAYTGLKLVFASVRQGWLETVNFIISASMGVVNGVTVLRSKLKTGWQVAFAGIEESFASVRDAFKMVGLKIQEAWQSMLAKMKLALGNFLLEVSQGMSGSGIAKVEAIAAKIGNMGVAVMKGSALGITEVKKEIDELTKAGEARARNNAALIEQILLQGQQEMNAGIQENMNGDFGQIAINFSRMTEQNREAWRKMISDTVGAELSSESMAKLIEQLRKAAEESAQAAVGGAKTLLTELNEQGVDAAGKLSSVFQGFFNGFDEGVKGMLNVWKQNLAKMASDNLAKSLLGALPGSSDSGGSDLGGLFKGLFGFARGGSFEVGGNGGTDSNLVAFRATKGERVTIQTPDQQRAGGGGNVININNYFQGSGGAPDATMLKELDRRDQKIKADIANAMRRKRF